MKSSAVFRKKGMLKVKHGTGIQGQMVFRTLMHLEDRWRINALVKPVFTRLHKLGSMDSPVMLSAPIVASPKFFFFVRRASNGPHAIFGGRAQHNNDTFLTHEAALSFRRAIARKSMRCRLAKSGSSTNDSTRCHTSVRFCRSLVHCCVLFVDHCSVGCMLNNEMVKLC